MRNVFFCDVDNGVKIILFVCVRLGDSVLICVNDWCNLILILVYFLCRVVWWFGGNVMFLFLVFVCDVFFFEFGYVVDLCVVVLFDVFE